MKTIDGAYVSGGRNGATIIFTRAVNNTSLEPPHFGGNSMSTQECCRGFETTWYRNSSVISVSSTGAEIANTIFS
jgi:hypothetical protein